MSVSKIEWTEQTWNPVTGCTKISPGCLNCYAKLMTKRLKAMGQKKYVNDFKLSDYNYAIKDLYHIPDGYISKGRILLYCGKTLRALKNFDMALRVASAEDLLILSGEDGVVEDIKDCYRDIKCQIKKYLKLNPEAELKRELKRWLALTRVRLGSQAGKSGYNNWWQGP